MTVALRQVPKVTGETSKKDVEFLLPNLANQGIKGEADEEVDEQAGIDLKQAVLRQQQMAGQKQVDQVAQQNGDQGFEKVGQHRMIRRRL